MKLRSTKLVLSELREKKLLEAVLFSVLTSSLVLGGFAYLSIVGSTWFWIFFGVTLTFLVGVIVVLHLDK